MSATDRLDRVAFGLRVTGVRPDLLLAADRPDWPELHVRRRRTAAAAGDDGGEPRLALGDDAWLDLRLDRAPGTATFVTPDAVDEDRPHVMLRLTALPAWRLRRPRGWAHMDAVVACVHETVAGADPSARRTRRAGRA